MNMHLLADDGECAWQVRLAAGETLDGESSEEEEEEEESGDELSEGERVRFDAPWSRGDQGHAEEEQGGAIWDRRSFAALADGDEVRMAHKSLFILGCFPLSTASID